MNILLISFDLQKVGHPERNLAMGNIVSSWKEIISNGSIYHESIDIIYSSFNINKEMKRLQLKWDFTSLNIIAFSVAVWSEEYVKIALNILPGFGFTGEIVLGGYQITGMDFEDLKRSFPDVRYFVRGYGEPALNKILDEISASNKAVKLISNTQLTDIPSPYVDGSIHLPRSVTTVNIETKRGCPYSCSYCSHDTVHKQRIIEKPVHKAQTEITYLVQKGIKKINIIDPVFNYGKTYQEITEFITEFESPPLFTLQYRLRKNMRKFLKQCQKGKIHLEIGIQSLDPFILQNISRRDVPNTILELLQEVSDYVPFDVSIIYGLPGQTLMSFEDTIGKLQTVTNNPIQAFPLMLLPGTKLHNDKTEWGYKENTNELGISYVRKSNSFSALDWDHMDQIAKKLKDDL